MKNMDSDDNPLRAVLGQMKNGKAPGEKQLTPEMLEANSRNLEKALMI